MTKHVVKVVTQPGPGETASFFTCSCGERGPLRLGPLQRDRAHHDANDHVRVANDHVQVSA